MCSAELSMKKSFITSGPGNFSCFCYHLLTFFKINFSKKISGSLSVSNSLDPDQDRRLVSPKLGPNCLQRLSANTI